MHPIQLSRYPYEYCFENKNQLSFHHLLYITLPQLIIFNRKYNEKTIYFKLHWLLSFKYTTIRTGRIIVSLKNRFYITTHSIH